MDWKRRMSVEVKDSDVKKLKLGDEVTIICKGKVKELELGDPEKRKKEAEKDAKDDCCCAIPYFHPSRVTIEMDSQKVESGENAFTTLAKDEEDD